MFAATSSFMGVQVAAAKAAAPAKSGRTNLVIEARRTKASSPSKGTKVRNMDMSV